MSQSTGTDTGEGSLRQGRYGSRSVPRSWENDTPEHSISSSTKSRGSLVDLAYHELQRHDQWVQDLEDGLPPDFGEAMDRLAGLRRVAERIVNESIEL